MAGLFTMPIRDLEAVLRGAAELRKEAGWPIDDAAGPAAAGQEDSGQPDEAEPGGGYRLGRFKIGHHFHKAPPRAQADTESGASSGSSSTPGADLDDDAATSPPCPASCQAPTDFIWL